jgi:hypothetical protein
MHQQHELCFRVFGFLSALRYVVYSVKYAELCSVCVEHGTWNMAGIEIWLHGSWLAANKFV